MNPTILEWRKYVKRKAGYPEKPSPSSLDVTDWYNVPYRFQPDKGWMYGYGIDWAGKVVERLTGLNLGDYMSKNIWQPLNMSSMTFNPATRPDLKDRIAGMTVRDGEGHLHRMGQHYWQEPVKYSGGGGCWGSCNDYIKLLTSLLRKDGKILKPETIELMFQGHLKDPSYLTKVHQNPALHALAGNIPQGTRLDHGLGGILNVDEVSTTGRAPYTMQWSGLPNL